jgi:hypothetical protein
LFDPLFPTCVANFSTADYKVIPSQFSNHIDLFLFWSQAYVEVGAGAGAGAGRVAGDEHIHLALAPNNLKELMSIYHWSPWLLLLSCFLQK